MSRVDEKKVREAAKSLVDWRWGNGDASSASEGGRDMRFWQLQGVKVERTANSTSWKKTANSAHQKILNGERIKAGNQEFEIQYNQSAPDVNYMSFYKKGNSKPFRQVIMPTEEVGNYVNGLYNPKVMEAAKSAAQKIVPKDSVQAKTRSKDSYDIKINDSEEAKRLLEKAQELIPDFQLSRVSRTLEAIQKVDRQEIQGSTSQLVEALQYESGGGIRASLANGGIPSSMLNRSQKIISYMEPASDSGRGKKKSSTTVKAAASAVSHSKENDLEKQYEAISSQLQKVDRQKMEVIQEIKKISQLGDQKKLEQLKETRKELGALSDRLEYDLQQAGRKLRDSRDYL